MRKNLINLLLIALSFCWFIGYFSKQYSWQEVSGFNEIPEQEKTSFYSPPDNRYPEIYWLGHAGNLIKWNGLNILLDPMLNNYSVVIPRLTKVPVYAEELPPIDFVFLSHMHYDHYDRDTLEMLSTIKNLVLPNKSEVFLSKKILSKTKIIPLNIGEEFSENSLRIVAVKALHNGSRNHPFTSDYIASGYLLTMDSISLYYAGDTGYGPHFQEVRELYAPNISILPIGAFEPYFILKEYHLSPEDAVKAGLDLASEVTIPTHFGTFRLALDRPNVALPRFATEANLKNLNWQLAPIYLTQ